MKKKRQSGRRLYGRAKREAATARRAAVKATGAARAKMTCRPGEGQAPARPGRSAAVCDTSDTAGVGAVTKVAGAGRRHSGANGATAKPQLKFKLWRPAFAARSVRLPCASKLATPCAAGAKRKANGDARGEPDGDGLGGAAQGGGAVATQRAQQLITHGDEGSGDESSQAPAAASRLPPWPEGFWWKRDGYCEYPVTGRYDRCAARCSYLRGNPLGRAGCGTHEELGWKRWSRAWDFKNSTSQTRCALHAALTSSDDARQSK